MNQQKLAYFLKYFPVFVIGIITDRFWVKAWETESVGMMFFSLGFGSYLAWLYWNWMLSQYEKAAIAKRNKELKDLTALAKEAIIENRELIAELSKKEE